MTCRRIPAKEFAHNIDFILVNAQHERDNLARADDHLGRVIEGQRSGIPGCQRHMRFHRVVAAFTGYHSGAVFRLTNGQVWQQRRYKYKYNYKYRPRVRIYAEEGKRLMEIDCMDEPIEVVRATVLDEGAIFSDFNGFDGSSRFSLRAATYGNRPNTNIAIITRTGLTRQ
jgi:hypothetical protein